MIARHRSAHGTSDGRSKWLRTHAHKEHEVRTEERGRHVLHTKNNFGLKYALENLVHMKSDDGDSSSSRNVPAL